MTRIKALSGIVVLAGMFAIMAIPARANFESNPAGKVTGKFPIRGGSLVAGGATLECSEARGDWTIQSTSKKDGTKQDPVLNGPHLGLSIEVWLKCTVLVAGIKTSATVTPCEIQLEQAAKALTATASVLKDCTITTTSCAITVGASTNKRLSKVVLENLGSDVRAKTELTGVKTTVTAGCSALGITAATNGVWTLPEILAEHLAAV